MFLPSNITLQFGDSGDFVAELQRRLAGIDKHPHDSINGFFDGVTVNSVSSFQSSVGIRADGIAGPETLRRLNGVISGESDTTDDKKEEEEKQHGGVDPLTRQFQVLDNMQQPSTFFGGLEATATAALGGAAVAAAAEHAASLGDTLTHAAGAIAVSAAPLTLAQDAQAIQQQIQRDNQMQIQAQLAQQQSAAILGTPTAGDVLAQLLQQQAQQSPAQALATPGRDTPASSTPTGPATQQTAALEASQLQPQQSRGVVGRAIAKMDALMQKLAEQFERTLPPSVIDEVKHIGQSMIASGVKEAPVAAGAEMGRPTPGAAIGQQQQAPQRG